ncbi:tyrosine-type recombinase/integrase [Sporosarcina sp. FSL K6-6792]|uniref:tyrosine-type recombinase/integrase n=1 Tax=Sporosarcina sp. FSL K6-6792 TaxID=2921559 RepID=UPI0030F69959
MQDTARLVNDINVIVTMLCPEVDTMKLSIRLEEVVSNYEIHRKTVTAIEKDIAEKVELFIASKRLEGLSEVSLKSYRIELGVFERYFSKAVVQITTTDIRQYLARNSSWKMSTVDTKLSILKTFFGWLVMEEILLRDPTSKINPPRKEKRLPKGLSIEELELIRETCKSLRERALIEVFYSTGCRLSELANMKTVDINMQSMSMKVIGKGNKERVVYLSFKALYHLNKYLNDRKDDCEYLFITLRKPYRGVGNRAIQREIDKIESRVSISKKLTPHTMRHTFAQLSMDAGIELSDLQHLMGHSNPGTTLIYSNVSEERKQQAFKKYHVQ